MNKPETQSGGCVERPVRRRDFLPGYPFQVWEHVGSHDEGIMCHAKTRKAAEDYAAIYQPLTAGYSRRKWHGRITIRKAPKERERMAAARSAWENFATAHPHEAHAKWPKRFWRFFHAKCPQVPRQEMEKMLRATES